MKSSKQTLIEKAKSAKRESRYVEFKEMFDTDSAADWCEIIKDIVAIANSGGGILIFGCKSDGMPTGYDCSKILNLDPAVITDKIQKYTNIQFSDFELEEISKNKKKVVAIIIDEIRIPMVFVKPGQYVIENNKQKTAFSQGTIYYRHGAKSEHCNSEDLKEIIQRNLDQIKKSWLGNIKKVVTAPTGSNVHVLPPNVVLTTSSSATPIRLTDDKSAPAFHLTSPDEIFKYRRKNVINEINKKLDGNKITVYDIQCIASVNDLYKNEKFIYLPSYSSPQYSDAFIEWVLDKYKKDSDFFNNSRQKYSERKK